jgi:hypothetical protein
MSRYDPSCDPIKLLQTWAWAYRYSTILSVYVPAQSNNLIHGTFLQKGLNLAIQTYYLR